jgi:two-component system response regulator
MLVLSRDCDSSIRIGSDIKIKVLSIRKQRVKIGVDAPSSIRVWRDEIAPPDEPHDDTPPAALAGEKGSDFPVLLVEDDADQAELVVRALAVSELPSVTVASSGAEALGAVLPSNGSEPRVVPSLILLDLNLPDMSGLEVLRQLRASSWFAAVPVVVLTAHRTDEMVKSCLAAGANAFVEKPVRYDEFVQSIGRIAAFWSHDNCVPGAAAVQTV